MTLTRAATTEGGAVSLRQRAQELNAEYWATREKEPILPERVAVAQMALALARIESERDEAREDAERLAWLVASADPTDGDWRNEADEALAAHNKLARERAR